MNIMCKKDLYPFKKGEFYEYWTNFGGLNHIVKYEENDIYPFDGPIDDLDTGNPSHPADSYRREWIFDYFYTLEEMRDIKIDQII